MAGYPGGHLQTREKELKNLIQFRLLTFFYKKQTNISLKAYFENLHSWSGSSDTHNKE